MNKRILCLYKGFEKTILCRYLAIAFFHYIKVTDKCKIKLSSITAH